MPVPSSAADLSTTAASNSPAGTDSIGTSLDEYLRSIQAIIKQENSKGSDIASGGTITIPSAGSYFVVTGTTTISAINDSWVGRAVVLKFSGALTLTNSSGLILPGGANITTASGDTGMFVNESAGVWRVVGFNVAAVTPTGYLSTADIGVSVQGYDVDTAKLDVDQTWSGSQRGSVTTLTDAATVALDLSTGNNFVVQLGGNRTLGAPTNVVANQSGTITVLQDKTGSRTLAYAWPYVWVNATAGTLSTAGATEDQLVYEVCSYNSATVTITIATPGVVTMNSHGFFHGQRIQITTSGALPTGLTASTTYFVETIDANSFYLCTSLADVAAGTRIATSGSQSGTHTLTGMTIRLQLNKGWA
jgi:hypothetical protein